MMVLGSNQSDFNIMHMQNLRVESKILLRDLDKLTHIIPFLIVFPSMMWKSMFQVLSIDAHA